MLGNAPLYSLNKSKMSTEPLLIPDLLPLDVPQRAQLILSFFLKEPYYFYRVLWDKLFLNYLIMVVKYYVFGSMVL